MRALTATELLAAWERGMGQRPADRPISILVAAGGEASAAELAQLPIGRRDARLLALREQTFGSRLLSVSTCPNCGEQVELDFQAGDIRVAPIDDLEETLSPIVLRRENFEITFRLADTLDLAAAAEVADAAAARDCLLERCVLVVRSDAGDEVSVTDLPEEIVAAIGERMAESDPQADIQLAVACPTCGHRWNAPFDIAGFFWIELQACAGRLLEEIHELAGAYGWSEADILSLTAARRQAYLERVRG